MIKFNYKFADRMIVGSDNGLDIEKEFKSYKNKIADIIIANTGTIVGIGVSAEDGEVTVKSM
ncbi:MAG: hypothetical protein IJA12_02540 [Oscillospiraceae bacterium]|nr:hypothetical protein [Oscillospiraceae bacterium]